MENNGFGMKWHKFLIYFYLWANAISNILFGVMALGVLGVGMIATGIYAIITRYKLANYRRGARYHLVAVGVLSGLLSTLLVMVDMDGSITSVIPSIVWAAINNYYYKKRDSLFVY